MKNSIFLGFIAVFIPFFNSSLGLARWAVQQDAQTEIEFYNRDIEIHADGTYQETIELQTKVLKEEGRNSLANQPLVYNSAGSELKVLKAKSIHNNKEYVLDSKLIEDKPLASSPGGFDQFHQILLAYPHSEINSKLYLKYQTVVKEPPLSKFFSTHFIYGGQGYWLTSRVRVTSQIPFYVAVNDPDQVLEVTQDHSSGKYKMEIQLKKPIFKEIVDEVSFQLNPKSLPWVTISTLKEWPSLAQLMAPSYAQVVQQPLPEMFKTIAVAAAKQTQLTGKINTVTSLLAENIKYMGDWRSVAGKYIPHDLQKIADSRLGDCKDFSVSTAAILKEMGIQASVSAVFRGENVYESPNDLPSLYAFNHVLVRVQSEDQVLWIDPTNFSSFAHGIFPDIADRWAMVLDPQFPTRERIPSLPPKSAQFVIDSVLDLKDQKQTDISGTLLLKGGASLGLTGAELRASKESIHYGVIQNVGDITRVSDWKVDSPSMMSRIVQDLSFEYQFKEKGNLLKTNLGPAVSLSSGYIISSLLNKVNDQVSDLYLGSPLTFQKKYLFKNILPIDFSPTVCSIQSRWVDVTRSFVNQKEGVEVNDTISLKKSRVENHEMRTPDFLQMQEKLDECFNGVAIVFSQRKTKKLN